MKKKFRVIKIISKIHGYVYLLSGGRFGTKLGSIPFVLLTTKGSKSGKNRTVPLTAISDGDRYILIASYGGSPTDPAWLTNLMHNPMIQIKIGTKTQDGEAQIIRATDSDEYNRLWEKAVAIYEGYARYQKATRRKIPIVVITPQKL